MESPITAMKQAFEDEEVLVLEESNHTDQNGSATLLALSEYERERGKPIPTFNHGSIQANLIIALAHTKRLYRVGSEVTIALADRQATPDICLYRRAPLNMLHDEFPASAPPLLAIEIVSSSQTLYELIRKAEAYFAAGVSSCWIVQPLIETVTVLHPNEKPRTVVEGTVEDPTLGISVRLEEIFRVNAQCGTCVKISP